MSDLTVVETKRRFMASFARIGLGAMLAGRRHLCPDAGPGAQLLELTALCPTLGTMRSAYASCPVAIAENPADSLAATNAARCWPHRRTVNQLVRQAVLRQNQIATQAC